MRPQDLARLKSGPYCDPSDRRDPCKLKFVRHELPKALRDDVRLLGELLGETLRRQEGQAIFDLVERVRALSKKARGGSDIDFATLDAGSSSRCPSTSAAGGARLLALPEPGQHRRAAPSHPSPPRLSARPDGAAAERIVRRDVRPR